MVLTIALEDILARLIVVEGCNPNEATKQEVNTANSASMESDDDFDLFGPENEDEFTEVQEERLQRYKEKKAKSKLFMN